MVGEEGVTEESMVNPNILPACVYGCWLHVLAGDVNQIDRMCDRKLFPELNQIQFRMFVHRSHNATNRVTHVMRLEGPDNALVHGLDQRRSVGWQEDHLDSLLVELRDWWMTWRVI